MADSTNKNGRLKIPYYIKQIFTFINPSPYLLRKLATLN